MPNARAYGTIVALSLGLIVGLMGVLRGLIGVLFGEPGMRISVLILGLIVGLIILVGVGLGCWSESPLKNGVISGSIGLLILILALIVGPRLGALSQAEQQKLTLGGALSGLGGEAEQQKLTLGGALSGLGGEAEQQKLTLAAR